MKSSLPTMRDIKNTHRIFGPNLANLRGKTMRTKPEHIRADYVKIPQDFMELHKYMTIVADVMFVNGLPYIQLSRNTKLHTTAGTMMGCLSCICPRAW
jgi:hypothetical protein